MPRRGPAPTRDHRGRARAAAVAAALGEPLHRAGRAEVAIEGQLSPIATSAFAADGLPGTIAADPSKPAELVKTAAMSVVLVVS